MNKKLYIYLIYLHTSIYILHTLYSKSLYVTAFLESCSSDQKKTVTICSKLLGRNKK